MATVAGGGGGANGHKALCPLALCPVSRHVPGILMPTKPGI
eukprot:COSAG03_NODE_29098_length_190_cov_25.516484_1_plen_40_part_10